MFDIKVKTLPSRTEIYLMQHRAYYHIRPTRFWKMERLQLLAAPAGH